MSFDETDLALFLRVIEQGSITGGARRVHLSLASASARIRAMESELGTPLLRRHRRGVSPTTAGWLLAAHARTLSGQLARLRADLATFAEHARATITLPANTAAATTLLPEILIDFLTTHPDIDVDLIESPSGETIAAVASGRAELGLVTDTAELANLHVTPIRPDTLVVVVPPGHPLAASPTTSFGECLEYPFVGYAEDNPLQEHLEAQVPRSGKGRQWPRYRARFPGTEAICRAVAAGVGIAVLPEPTVTGSRRDLDLRLVGLTDAWADRGLVLCTASPAALTPPAAALARHIAEAAERMPPTPR